MVCPYGIGDILYTKNPVNPADRWPNTKWTQIQGMFLLGQSSSHALNTTGGEETHTLTVDEMPSHNHDPIYATKTNGVQETITFHNSGIGAGAGGLYWSSSPTIATINTTNRGSGVSHNNMPPYMTVYIWERTE